MNKISNPLKILTILVLLQMFVLNSTAQIKNESSNLTNDSVIELVKAGISEGIIIAKIKNSNGPFDTSSTALIKLKNNGVSENIILAMVDSKPNVIVEKEDNNIETQKTAEIKEAVGKRKIYLVTEDEESRLELRKRLTAKGFTFVDDKKMAELIFELKYDEGTTQQKVGILRGGNETELKTKIGKLVVKLNQDATQYLIYAREYNYARGAAVASAFGLSAAPPSLRDQVKYFFVDDFLKQMKKAGDKFK